MSYPKWFTKARTCAHCGSEFFPVSWIGKSRKYTETRKRYENKIYCDNACRSSALALVPPEENYFYGKSLVPWNKGNRKDWRIRQTNGYVRIIHPDGSFTYEHRSVANAPKGMVVHHIDENRENNIPENLSVMTHSEHMSLHARMRRWK